MPIFFWYYEIRNVALIFALTFFSSPDVEMLKLNLPGCIVVTLHATLSVVILVVHMSCIVLLVPSSLCARVTPLIYNNAAKQRRDVI